MKKTILLVEDSRIQKLISERILLRAGYLVLLASDGEEGLRLASESLPDLVLLDLLLPGIGGEEVLYALKRDARTERLPVIVVSHVVPNAASHLKTAGAEDYFEKSRFEDADGEVAFLAMIDEVLRGCEVRNKAARSTPQLAQRHRTGA